MKNLIWFPPCEEKLISVLLLSNWPFISRLFTPNPKPTNWIGLWARLHNTCTMRNNNPTRTLNKSQRNPSHTVVRQWNGKRPTNHPSFILSILFALKRKTINNLPEQKVHFRSLIRRKNPRIRAVTHSHWIIQRQSRDSITALFYLCRIIWQEKCGRSGDGESCCAYCWLFLFWVNHFTCATDGMLT